jgi:penicillin-binding protein 1C
MKFQSLLPHFLKKILVLFIFLLTAVILIDFCFPYKFSIPYSTQILDQEGNIIHAFLSKDDKWRLHIDEKELTPLLKKTLIHKEDKYFYYHFGINPLAILRAVASNFSSGKRVSGASTITMQVVRLIQPNKRTYTNKIVEAWRAIQLELHYSKSEILQLYLNLVPYGGNIQGIKAASLLYFGKKPQLLSLGEITLLTIIPNRPSSLRPGRQNISLKSARDQWLSKFENANLFTSELIDNAKHEPVTMRRRAAPTQAPHLALRLKREYPNTPVLHTSLHANLQHQIEEQVSHYIKPLRGLNIHNAAVLVINNETMQVEAYVGSADFNNRFDGGQVDGIRAVRSPGSTLKPILYGIGFDLGVITPKKTLYDVPTNFSGYQPENFDQRFNGRVTTSFALANSLNIPAVKILKDVGTTLFIGKLSKSDFKTIKKQKKDLGLSMILGGCGVTLEELTRLFSCFAHEGALTSIRYLAEKKKVQLGEQLISKEAAYMVTDILSQVTRPDLPTNFENTYRLPKIAWKTGTSYGKRDAWSIGYNKKYTIGVWVGNFSGEGVPELSGANIATPLLFSVFNSLDYNSSKGWYNIPENLSLRKVCAESGNPPADFCTHQITDQYIVGISSNKICSHMKWVFTDLEGKIAYCSYCMPEKDFEKRAYPNHPPELIAYQELNHLPYLRLPKHNPLCERVFYEGEPLIVSPNSESEYYIRQDEPQQLQLSSQVANDVEEVHWYINDVTIGKTSPHEALFFSPPLGRVKISCSDDKGRSTSIWITVKKL